MRPKLGQPCRGLRAIGGLVGTLAAASALDAAGSESIAVERPDLDRLMRREAF